MKEGLTSGTWLARTMDSTWMRPMTSGAQGPESRIVAASKALPRDLTPMKTFTNLCDTIEAEATIIGFKKGTHEYFEYFQDRLLKEQYYQREYDELKAQQQEFERQREQENRMEQLQREEYERHREQGKRMEQLQRGELHYQDIQAQKEAQQGQARNWERRDHLPTNSFTSHVSRGRVPALKPFNPEKEWMDQFLTRFDEHMMTTGMQKPEALVCLISLLPPDTLALVKSLPAKLQDDYDEVRRLLKDAHRITAETLRASYFTCTPASNESMARFSQRVIKAFDDWVSACGVARSYDALREFFIVDRIFSVLPPSQVSHLKDRGCSTIKSLTETIDEHLDALSRTTNKGSSSSFRGPSARQNHYPRH